MFKQQHWTLSVIHGVMDGLGVLQEEENPIFLDIKGIVK